MRGQHRQRALVAELGKGGLRLGRFVHAAMGRREKRREKRRGRRRGWRRERRVRKGTVRDVC